MCAHTAAPSPGLAHDLPSAHHMPLAVFPYIHGLQFTRSLTVARRHSLLSPDVAVDLGIYSRMAALQGQSVALQVVQERVTVAVRSPGHFIDGFEVRPR